MTRAALGPALCLLAACGARSGPPPDPPEHPITVTIENTGAASVFLGHNDSPFTVSDASGASFRTALHAYAFMCDDCDWACNVFVDASQAYVELPPGARHVVSWDGRLYRQVSQGCYCDRSCMVRFRFPRGSYTFAVHYTDQPPAGKYTTLAQGDGTTLWVADSLGLETSTLKEAQRFPLSFAGQTAIRLELR